MKKAIAIALVALMALSAVEMMPAKVKAGIADNMQGGNLNVYGYDNLLYFDQNKKYHANITAFDINSGAVTHAYNAGGEVNDGDYYNDNNYWCEYVWDATSAKYGWKPSPPASGDAILLVSEMPANGLGSADGSNPQNNMGSGNGINYTYAVKWPSATTSNVADDQYAWYGRYEPIPIADGGDRGELKGYTVKTEEGDSWINMSIPLPKYTDWNDTGGKVMHRGTFDVWNSYAVFIESPDDPNYETGVGPYDGWYFVGNAYNVSTGPDSPLPAYEQGKPTDPSTIDTGHAWINITGLQPNSNYYFMIRTNFDFGSHRGGYHGGMRSGAYTVYVSSGKFRIQVGEFPTMLIPVFAVIGMFMVATYAYRRK